MHHKKYPHPIRMRRVIYSQSDLDPKWNYLLLKEVSCLKSAIHRIEIDQKNLRIQLQEAAQQSTENFGHDDATQESIRLQLWTMSSQLDHLRDALLHHSLLKEPTSCERTTLGHVVELESKNNLRVMLVGGANLPLERVYLPKNITAVSYKSPLGSNLLGSKIGSKIYLNDKTLTVTKIYILK